jgi:hypothetical protein
MRVLLALILVGLLAGIYWQHRKIAQQEHQITALISSLAASTPPGANLELQERCAKQARAVFVDDGWAKKPYATFSDHFNTRMNRCFVRYEDDAMSNGKPSRQILIFDAFEQKVYGSYLWLNTGQKKYWEVKPFECKITGEGDQETCDSEDAFNELTKQYMADVAVIPPGFEIDSTPKQPKQ